MKRPRLKPSVIIMIGLAVCFAGLIYGGIFAGVSYAEPTPTVQARWNLHVNVASFLIIGGLVVFVAGAVMAIVRLYRSN